jgi:CheY-like chemotaxis protein
MQHILVIDDEFGVAEVLEAILTDLGYQVATAINGRQGLERVREQRPDLILLDMMMPVMDGAGVLRALVADPALASIPVIVMSSLPETTVLTLASGYKRFLRKPFKLRDAVTAVRATLG